MTVDELLRQGRLAPLEARILVGHALQWSRVQLVTRSQDTLSTVQLRAIDALFRRRESGEPIAYITGVREFHGLDFDVTPAVLIPRPETELLVELAIARLPRGGSAIDLGTGSGAIAVALAHARRDAKVSAADISEPALAVARRNAAAHGVSVTFVHSDWYAAVSGQFDVIVSNPPYIASSDPHLSQGDLRFEPRGALTDGANGMMHIGNLIDGAPAHLKAGGWLLMEHGHDQAAATRALLERAGWQQVQSWTDLAGIERVTGGVCPTA